MEGKMKKYKRIILKLSGEALADKSGKMILEAHRLDNIAEAIKIMVGKGVQVGVVIGAGNIWRGKLAEQIGIDRSTADYMGMLGTIINSMALQSAIEKLGIECRVMSAVEVRAVAEPYIRRKAIRHLEKNRVVIFAGGTGNPYFTTDTTASLRAMEMEAQAILMAKNGVDGVYSDDPEKNPDAKFIPEITFKEMINQNLKVMDPTAASLLMEKNIEINVFNMNDLTNFEKILNGERVGTIIRKGE